MEWVMIAVAALIIILLVLAIVFRDKNHKTDYHAFFIMGIIWVGAGIPLMVTANSPGLFFLGIVFMAVGLIHHKKWKQNIKDRHKNIKKMSKKEKKRHFILRLIMLIALILGLIVLLVFFFLSG
jgi:4-amino-4-deoxy-L-arabinose transferase-like glycosyltransferase